MARVRIADENFGAKWPGEPWEGEGTMTRRLTIREWLWCKFHYICTRHGVEKELYGYSEDCQFDCPECVKEREAKFESKKARILGLLSGRGYRRR